MFNKKNLLVTVLSLILLFTMTACGGKDKVEEPAENATENSAEATNTEETNEEATEETEGEASASGIVRPEGVPEDYPNKEIHYLYGFSPGSVQDAYIRILFDKIKEMEGWKYGLIVDYQEGASGRIQWNALANAKPDGYTIGFTPTAMLIPSVAEADEVDFGYDKYAYIFSMMSDPGAIGVAADSEYNSLEELVNAAKENPGKISLGVTSVIGSEGLTVKLIEKDSGAKFNTTAFNGGADVMAGVIGGHVDAFCLNITDTTTFVENGQIKVLATGNNERSEFMPDVPTYKENGYDVIQLNTRAVSGPKEMPEPIRQYLENCLVAAANDPEVKKQAEEMKAPTDSLTGEEVSASFGEFYDMLTELWADDPWQ
ncbi:MAG: tripartite tricarboxylate transporter substrate binding protein [Peptoniphilus sp.]|nr:tripartite tricarboxylate transporter substrate binding protein [Peptoniphilus sp.]